MSFVTDPKILEHLNKAAAASGEVTDPNVLTYLNSHKPNPPANPPMVNPYAQKIANMSFGQNLRAGIGMGMANLAQGAGERLGEQIQKTKPIGQWGLRRFVGEFANPIGAISGPVESALGAAHQLGLGKYLPTAQDVARTRELQKPLASTGGGKVGDAVGTAAAAAPLFVLPGANTYLGAMGIGGLLGYMQPTAPGESPDLNALEGGLGAGLGLAGGRVAVGAMKGVKSLIEPFYQKGISKIAGRVMRDFAHNPDLATANLAHAQEFIPGSTPTMAEASNDLGLARLQKTLSNASNSAAGDFRQRAVDQNMARVNALRELGGDDNAMAAAKQARSAAANPLREQLKTSQANVNSGRTVGLIDRILNGAGGQRDQLASALRGIRAKLATVDANGNPVLETDPEQLYGIRQHITDLMHTKGPNGSAINESIMRELQAVKDSLDHQIKKAVPSYADYLSVYQNMSKPIDQMKIGREILSGATANSNAMGGEPALYPNSFGRMMKNAPQLVKRATGFKRAKGFGDYLTLPQQSTLSNIQADLDRQAEAQRLMKESGSDTLQNAVSSNFLRQALGPLGAPSHLLTSLPARSVGRVMDWVYGKPVEEKLLSELTKAGLDPKYAAKIMANSTPTEKAQMLQQLVSRAGAAIGTALPAAATAASR